MGFMEKLRQRWGVKTLLDVLIILLVFTCTGFTSLYVKKPLFEWLGIPDIGPYFLRGILYTISLLAFYNILLLVYGFLFGKFRFFYNFEKRFFGRFVNLFVRKKT